MFMEILIVSFKTGSEKELSELIKTEKDRIKEIDKHKAILIKDQVVHIKVNENSMKLM